MAKPIYFYVYIYIIYMKTKAEIMIYKVTFFAISGGLEKKFECINLIVVFRAWESRNLTLKVQGQCRA